MDELKLSQELQNVSLSALTRDQLLEVLEANSDGGIRVAFSGKTNARQLARKVRPRVTRTEWKLSAGPGEQRSRNLLIEGDNLQAMTTLYRERGQVDLVLTDPPYNTGKDWRYNDRWEEDPNDVGLGEFVAEDDTARHTKWMRFMWPRLQMMKAMLRPSGVLAICIDHRELFRLGQMLDELFDEKNRLGIINWQKSTAPRNDSNHVSSATEYILIYAKSEERAETEKLPRSPSSNSRYRNPDDDPKGVWREHDLSARTPSEKNTYGIQSPFTGEVYYPPGTRCWSHPKRNIKKWLEEWGTPYVERDIADGNAPALILKGGKVTVEAGWEQEHGPRPGNVPDVVAERAEKRLAEGAWPFVWFGMTGTTGPRVKRYLESVRKGIVPITYWADDPMDEPLDIGCTSWDYEESGLSQTGIKELNAIVGRGHGFETVKPLELMEKIVQLWCPADGTVLDPFVGSGTTAHAVLSLNAATGTNRRFIAIEQGRPEKGDSYARTLTADRLRRVVEGKWANGKGEPLGGGYQFIRLGKKVDAAALLRMERDEMVDTVIGSHFDETRRRGDRLVRVEAADGPYQYLVAHDSDDEGFFLVWGGPEENTDFTEEVYEACAEEAERAGINPKPLHVYARLYRYPVETVRFYQIPDRILADFGLDLSSEPFAELDDD